MELKLPELGEGVHEGELVKWRVKVGDEVKDDQPLCDIMTDKATIELPSSFKGKITALNAKEGEVVKVGQVMMTYESAGGSAKAAQPAAVASSPAPAAPAKSAPSSHSQPAMSAAPRAPQSSAPVSSGGTLSIGGSVTAAPATRRLAREMGVDITKISGSGPNGRVMNEDLRRGAGATAAGPALPMRAPNRVAPGVREERIAFRGLRKKIAEKMRTSLDTAAHFAYVEEADATELVKVRKQAKELGEAHGIKVTYLPFVMKAMVAALKRYPHINSELDEAAGELVVKHYYNISLSIQTDDGLTAPVVKDVENKSILQIAKDIQDLVDRARAKKLTLEDFQGGTITLTNAGSIGGLFTTPVINYPEVAILGFNKISKKPVVKTVNGKDEVVIRDWTFFSISLDHRIVDGAIAAEFMKVFIQYIENPSLLLLESL